MKLYGYWRSSATWRVRIALALKGLDYDYAPINLLMEEQKSAEYLKANPQGLVPTLATDDGARLTQSLAIIEWLEENYPKPAILPASAVERVTARAIAAAIACEAQPFGNLRMMRYLKTELGFDDQRWTKWLNRWVGATLIAIESMALQTAGRFCIGDAPSVADAFLIPQLYAARRFNVDLSRCKTLLAIEAACSKLDAFNKAHPDNQPDAVKG